MSTSESTRYWRYNPNILSEDEPIDTGAARRVVNNVMHLADESGQVLANMTTLTGDSPITPESVPTTYFGELCYFGPFPIRIRSDGTSYRVRTRIACRGSNVNYAVTFRVTLAKSSWAARESLINGDNVFETTVQTAAISWTNSALLLLDANQVNASIEERNVHETTATGAPDIGVKVLHCVLHVSAKSAHAGTEPELYGLYAAEYIGTT